MLEGVTGKRCVVHFDVHLEVLVEFVCLEETDNGLCIDIVLMFGGLHRLGLDEESSLETLCTSIVASHGQHGCHVLLFTLHIGVQEAHITLATTPEDIVGTAQLDGSIDGILNLHNGTGYNIEVGIGACAIHVALVTKDVGCAPKQLDTSLGLLLLQIGDNLLQVFLVLLNGSCFSNEVNVVEAIVVDAELLHDFEAGIGLVFSCFNGIFGFVPWECLRARTKLVASFCTKGVPPAHSKFEPIAHLFAHDHFVTVIVAISQRIFTLHAFELDGGNLRKKLFHRIGY